MYQGSVNAVPDYFGARGHPNPPNYNPGDWIMNVAQTVDVDTLKEHNFFPEDEREMGEAFTEGIEGKDEIGITITTHHRDKSEGGAEDLRHVTVGTQTRLLFDREITNLKRDHMAVGARFGLTTFLSILIGIIFLDVAQSDREVNSNVQSTFGALIMVLLMSMFGTAQPALLSFPEERPVFLREYSTNHYSVVSYFS